MKIIAHPRDVPNKKRPLFLAMGFFDGVHRGHQKILTATLNHARRGGGQVWVLTMQPHPLKIIRPQAAPPLLTALPQKLRLLKKLGLHGCIVLPFTRQTARQPAPAFVRDLKKAMPNLRGVFVGENWRFGRDRQGDVDLLKDLAARQQIQTTVVAPHCHAGRLISSTRVRQEVAAGRMGQATALLGRPFGMQGKVVRGRQIGRTLAMPTANLNYHNELTPPNGVYAVMCRLGNAWHAGVANLGLCPTFPGVASKKPILEVHLFDFQQSIYGKNMEVFFLRRLRGERRFANQAALARQMQIDARRAKTITTQLPAPPGWRIF